MIEVAASLLLCAIMKRWKFDILELGRLKRHLFLFAQELRREESMAKDDLVTVEEVQNAQDSLKSGISLHEKKSFKEAIEEFKKIRDDPSF